MTVISALTHTDVLSMDGDGSEYDQREAAFEWLMDDPTNRAIVAPTELDAILDMYRMRDEHPDETFTRAQFLSEGQSALPGTETRFVGFRTYFFS